MSTLIQSYQTRLAQLNHGCKELYDGERAIIDYLIRAYRKMLDN